MTSKTPSIASLRASYPKLAVVRAPAPADLDREEAQLWRDILDRVRIEEAHHLDLLAQGLRCRGIARRHLAIADDEGPMVTDRFGQTKEHPLYKSANRAHRTYLQCMRDLG